VNKTAKTALTGFLIVLLALVLVVCALPELINPNNYKAELSDFIKRKTGRTVLFKGDVTLSVWPELGLNIENMEVSNKSGFQEIPFMAVDNSAFKLKPLSLLRNKVELDSVVLDGLRLNLIKDKRGFNNWDGLFASSLASPSRMGTAQQDKAQFTGQSVLAALTVSDIDIQNGRVNWVNQQTGEHLEIKDMRFEADQFVLGEWVTMKMAMDISGRFANCPLPPSWAIKGVADLRVDEKLERFIFRNNRIEGVVLGQPASAPPLAAAVAIPNATLSLETQAFQLSGLHFRSGGVDLAAELAGQQVGKPSVHGSVTLAPFNPRDLSKQWGITLPTLRGATALTRLDMTFSFKANPGQAEFNNLDVVLDDSHGKGSLRFKGLSVPTVFVDLTVDTIDLDRYLVPKDKPTHTDRASASTYAAALDWLRKLDIEGNIRLGKMTFKEMGVENARLTLTPKKGLPTSAKKSTPKVNKKRYARNRL
jgi:AsmA protein